MDGIISERCEKNEFRDFLKRKKTLKEYPKCFIYSKYQIIIYEKENVYLKKKDYKK